MAQPYIGSQGTTEYREALGSGTAASPYVPQFYLASLPAFATTPNVNIVNCDTQLDIGGSVTAYITNTSTQAIPVYITTAPNLTFTNTSFIANAGTNLNTSLLALESGGNLASINTKLPNNLTVNATRLLVDGSGATQPISASVLPLPTGAATSAKQPALGTAGTASTDVITVQGITGGTAQPVSLVSLPALATGSNTIGAISNTSFASTQSGTWNTGISIPSLVNDVTSAAITTTTTSSTITPTSGHSYSVFLNISAVSGTNPTLDVDIQESDDSGTNWFTVYSFPRITATGQYRSPKLALSGNRIRYVQTLGGTSPSFTRLINRLQSSDSIKTVRQLIDRSIVLTTLNSNTPNLNVQVCDRLQLSINIGAATTVPNLQLQGSDDNGTSWYAIGSTLTAIASSTVTSTASNINAQLVRAIVTSAGSGITMGYVLLKGF